MATITKLSLANDRSEAAGVKMGVEEPASERVSGLVEESIDSEFLAVIAYEY